MSGVYTVPLLNVVSRDVKKALAHEEGDTILKKRVQMKRKNIFLKREANKIYHIYSTYHKYIFLDLINYEPQINYS